MDKEAAVVLGALLAVTAALLIAVSTIDGKDDGRTSTSYDEPSYETCVEELGDRCPMEPDPEYLMNNPESTKRSGAEGDS